MQKIKYKRDDVLSDLRESACELFFTDTTGKRVGLRCSLKSELLPESYSLTEESKERAFHENNPDIVSVWDLVNGGWKQFHIENHKL